MLIIIRKKTNYLFVLYTIVLYGVFGLYKKNGRRVYMLRKIKAEAIRDGMIFSMPLFFDDGKNRFLGKLSPVTQRELTILKRWKIPFVLTEGTLVHKGENTPSLVSDADEFIAVDYHFDEDSDSDTNNSYTDVLLLPETDGNMRVYAQYSDIVHTIDSFFSDFKNQMPVEPRPLDDVAVKLCDLIRQDKNVVLLFIISVDIPGKHYAKAAVDAAILVYIMAGVFDLSREHITDSVIAALLHNCGMLRIPQAVIEKENNRSQIERKMFAAHPIYGYRAALSDFLYEERIALTILQSHERWDGKGYPSGLKQEKITIGARLIAVADAFISMLKTKSHQKRLSGHNALRILFADKGQRFEYSIVKVLIQCLGFYPIGSVVRLSDDSVARVIMANVQKPLLPRVRILSDKDGKLFLDDKGFVVDLAAQNTLSIAAEVEFPFKQYHV